MTFVDSVDAYNKATTTKKPKLLDFSPKSWQSKNGYLLIYLSWWCSEDRNSWSGKFDRWTFCHLSKCEYSLVPVLLYSCWLFFYLPFCFCFSSCFLTILESNVNLQLVDLKYSVGGGSNLRDQVDQYGELLGQRKHFLLHATFALLSYFVFGLVPPVIYGFTFRKSNDKDYKLIAVAAASLLCVILLATAKAYTRGANKFGKYFKTILSYVIAACMASGVGYAAGHLIKRLMDDFGWFDSKPAPSFFSPEMISQNPAWASNWHLLCC